jgi:hypothetical protein
MEYYAIYEITGIGSKELIGFVAPAQSSMDRLADNADDIPAISPEVAAGNLGRMLAKNRPWTVLKNNEDLVGSSFGSGSRHDEFYNDSCIDNYQILKAQAEALVEMNRKLARPVKPKTDGKPSIAAKLAGFDSLNQLAEITGESVQTLNNWYKNNPRRFSLVAKGAQAERLVSA